MGGCQRRAPMASQERDRSHEQVDQIRQIRSRWLLAAQEVNFHFSFESFRAHVFTLRFSAPNAKSWKIFERYQPYFSIKCVSLDRRIDVWCSPTGGRRSCWLVRKTLWESSWCWTLCRKWWFGCLYFHRYGPIREWERERWRIDGCLGAGIDDERLRWFQSGDFWNVMCCSAVAFFERSYCWLWRFRCDYGYLTFTQTSP